MVDVEAFVEVEVVVDILLVAADTAVVIGGVGDVDMLRTRLQGGSISLDG